MTLEAKYVTYIMSSDNDKIVWGWNSIPYLQVRKHSFGENKWLVKGHWVGGRVNIWTYICYPKTQISPPHFLGSLYSTLLIPWFRSIKYGYK